MKEPVEIFAAIFVDGSKAKFEIANLGTYYEHEYWTIICPSCSK